MRLTNAVHANDHVGAGKYVDEYVDHPLVALANIALPSSSNDASPAVPVISQSTTHHPLVAERREIPIGPSLDDFSGSGDAIVTGATLGYLVFSDLTKLAAAAWSTYRISHILGLASVFGMTLNDIPEATQHIGTPSLCPDGGLSLSPDGAVVLESQRLQAQHDTSHRYELPPLFCQPSETAPPQVHSDHECKQQ